MAEPISTSNPQMPGDPIYLSSIGIEVWEPIPNFPNHEVSNLGNFRSLNRIVLRKDGKHHLRRGCPIAQNSTDSGGYLQLRIRNKMGEEIALSSHRVVASVFIPNPNNLPEVNHKAGDKIDNRAFMLEWSTHKDNIKHAVETGLMKRGQQLNYSKLVLDTQTGIFYESITEAAIWNGIKNRTLHHWLNGDRKNKSSLILV